MVVLQHIAAPDGVAAGRGYSQVVTGRGRLVVISGQVAQDESGELVGPGDPAAQARQVFENLRRCLAQAGAGFGDVLKLTFFVLDVADLPAVRAARDAVIDTARPPASTAVQVAALFAPGYVLEVEAWALVDDLSAPHPVGVGYGPRVQGVDLDPVIVPVPGRGDGEQHIRGLGLGIGQDRALRLGDGSWSVATDHLGHFAQVVVQLMIASGQLVHMRLRDGQGIQAGMRRRDGLVP